MGVQSVDNLHLPKVPGRSLPIHEFAGQQERRRRVRTRVRWEVDFPGVERAGTVVSVTENLSSNGFCCLSPVSLTPGEIRTCILKVPTHHPKRGERICALECRMKVVWVTRTEEVGIYRLGCQIEDYRLRRVGSGAVVFIDHLVTQPGFAVGTDM